jgi:hypothetical protein
MLTKLEYIQLMTAFCESNNITANGHVYVSIESVLKLMVTYAEPFGGKVEVNGTKVSVQWPEEEPEVLDAPK